MISGAVCLVALLLAGCGGGTPTTAETEPPIKKMYILYSEYAGKHGRPPAGEPEFSTWVRSLPADRLKALGAADAEAILTSPRDGKAYQVRYGLRYVPGPEAPPVLAHERAGADGGRMVVFANGQVEEVDEPRFKELVPQK